MEGCGKKDDIKTKRKKDNNDMRFQILVKVTMKIAVF
jgi:hypothetical protein